jgi:hypothetical protein
VLIRPIRERSVRDSVDPGLAIGFDRRAGSTAAAVIVALIAAAAALIVLADDTPASCRLARRRSTG